MVDKKADGKADKKADKKGAAADGGSDDIMSSGEMKPLLAKAKRGDPVSCAVALTKDKEGVILLDKRKKPKKLLAEMKKQAATLGLELETTTLRFGHASVDPDEDAALVTFTLNKEAPGAMRPRLLERLKKAGFTKIELIVDANLEVEPEEDEATAAAGAPPSPEPSPEPSPATAAGSPPGDTPAATPAAQASATPNGPTPSAPTPGGPTPGGPDPGGPAPGGPVPGGPAPVAPMAALQQALAGLLKQMAAVLAQAPDRKAALLQLAQDATAAVKSNDPARGQQAVEQLRDAVGAASNGAAPNGAPSHGAPAGAAGEKSDAIKGALKLVATSRKAWTLALKKVEGDIDTLLDELSKVYKDHGIAGDLERIFRAKVDPMMAAFDAALGEKLEEVANCADPAQFAKLVADARQVLKRYQSSLAGEPLIAKLDANPVAPIAVGRTMTLTLQTLDKTLASVAAAHG